MSIIAGIYTSQWTPELHDIQQRVEQYISRNPDDDRHCYHDDHLFFCQVDYQCYGGAARAENEQVFASVIGHPLLSASISHDLITLLTAKDWQVTLKQAQGTFCAFQYQKARNELLVYCDTLALRPYYIMSYKGAVIFSSCLRIFPDLGVQLDNNLDAISELATLGYTLGDKTRFKQVSVARPGEMMVLSPEGIQRKRYFRWADVPNGHCSIDEGIERLDRSFKQAVSLYLGNDQHTVSTLSGGLDSRLIATELKRRGAGLECLNFSRGNSQDELLSQRFADSQQIPLHRIYVSDTQTLTVEQRLGVHWKVDDFSYYSTVKRPRLFWSGNGGSVCVGQIYTDDKVVEACRRGDPEQLADCYINQQMAYIPSRLVRQGDELQQRLRNNILDALSEYEHLPLLKAYQLFLWENDQHHHIALPFEEMDQFQLDFCLPFYSRGVLEAMFSMETEWALRHGIYMKWLERCYPQALTTPWQTYPGHIPCPLPVETEYSNQWQFRTPLQTKARLIKQGVQTVFNHQAGIYNRHFLGMQCALTALGVYDCTPSLRLVERMNQHMV
ncbi:galactosyl transferase [uncultured Photobacterium sp.]|uniref:galactosyl transferase n=1 Tax=uncultured Photobacterium sp. TaxID=173973 RepID=UPI00261EF5A6|nr:galactosyl transferase [uncultured Photobacterium sp.]